MPEEVREYKETGRSKARAGTHLSNERTSRLVTGSAQSVTHRRREHPIVCEKREQTTVRH